MDDYIPLGDTRYVSRFLKFVIFTIFSHSVICTRTLFSAQISYWRKNICGLLIF